MALQKISIKPGVFRNNTNYSSEGRYFDGDKVRFRSGVPEKIGGWSKYSSDAYVGTCTALFGWNLLSGVPLLAFGSNLKYYIDESGVYHDVTPVQRTATTTGASLSVTNGSAVLRITDTHTAGLGDYLTVSGAVGFGGITAAQINKEHIVTNLTSSYVEVVLSSNATSNAAGGAEVVHVYYQLNVAPEYGTMGYGWGAGAWGTNTSGWGTSSESGISSKPRLWAQTAFGEIHVFAPVGGAIYYHMGADLTARALPLSGFSGSSDVPLMCVELLMSKADRHLIAFGCNPVGSTDQDPLLIRWCDTEDLANWTPSQTNASGDLRVGSGNTIVTAVQTKQEIVVFTDGSLHSMQYVGAPYTYGILPVGENISIASKNSVAVANNIVYWIGTDKFYTYNGSVNTLPCDVYDYVFSNINSDAMFLVCSGTNEGFSEVWWHYPTKGSTVNNRYVIYNYIEQCWYYGSLTRTAWLDCPSRRYPIAAYNGHLYLHEFGIDDDYFTPIESFIETADFDLADGDKFVFARRIIPDVSFTNSNTTTPQVTMVITPRNTPGGAYFNADSPTVKTTNLDITQYTEQCHIRIRGRQIKFRIESNQIGCQWRLGSTRVDVQTDGAK